MKAIFNYSCRYYTYHIVCCLDFVLSCFVLLPLVFGKYNLVAVTLMISLLLNLVTNCLMWGLNFCLYFLKTLRSVTVIYVVEKRVKLPECFFTLSRKQVFTQNLWICFSIQLLSEIKYHKFFHRFVIKNRMKSFIMVSWTLGKTCGVLWSRNNFEAILLILQKLQLCKRFILALTSKSYSLAFHIEHCRLQMKQKPTHEDGAFD